MAASTERIRQVVDDYIRLVGSGTADEIVALYAEDATVEDPVGTDVRTGHAAIREFYAGLEGLEQETRLIASRIAGGEAVFHFEIVTRAGEQDLHAVADRRDDVRRRRQDHHDARLLGRRTTWWSATEGPHSPRF